MANNDFTNNLRSAEMKLENIFGVDKIEDIQTEKIKSKLKDFRALHINELIKELESTMLLSDSPVFIGMLGRYSHGKSALVNALFGLDGTESELPTGDGVVTSQVTVVNFDTELKVVSAFEQPTKKSITIDELRNRVKADNIDTSGIAYYEMNLPTGDKEFASKFANKKINLIDLPGLGGQYFNDSQLTQRYIEDLDMLIVTIKISEIEDAARSIRKFVENATVPIIPVLTYEDLWNESELYSGCSYQEMISKAESLVCQYLPSLANTVANNLIAVSALTKKNIDQLRNVILSHVEVTAMKTRDTKHEVSAVYRRKSQKLVKAIEKVRSTANTCNVRFDEIITEIAPKGKSKVNYSDVFEKREVIRDFKIFKKECTKAVDDFYDTIKDKISAVSSKSTLKDVRECVEKINTFLQNKAQESLKNDLNNSFKEYKSTIRDAMCGYIDNLAINQTEKDDRNSAIKDGINEFVIFWDDTPLVKPVNVDDLYAVYGARKGLEKIMAMLHLGNVDKTRLDKLKQNIKDRFQSSIDKNDLKESIVDIAERANKQLMSDIDNLDEYNSDIKNMQKKHNDLRMLVERINEDLDEEQRNN